MTKLGLIERIDANAIAHPDRVAHRSEDRSLTWGELGRCSDTLAARLAAELPDDGSPIVVLGHKEPEMLVAFLGAVKAGHPYVPLDSSLPAARIERIRLTSEARLVLTPDEVKRRCGEDRARAPARGLRRDDPFYVMYTSGSTGEPKGVIITLGSLETFVDWMIDEQRFAGGEVFLDQAPFSFDLSIMDLYPALATGGTVFSVTRDDVANPRRLFVALAASQVTTWVSTPSFARLCLADRTFGAALLPRVGRFLFCGETLSPEVAAELRVRFPAAGVWNTYGPTEATVATTSILVDDDVLRRWSPLPVGRAMPGIELLILEEGRPVADGERGEIVIVGPNVSAGYLGRADLTERAFVDVGGRRGYRTGDWGRLRGGLLFFEGRRDSQVKLFGHRIELGDVEAHLCALPGVRDAVVLKQDRPERLVAFVVPSEEDDGALALRLREELAARVPPYMVPARIRFLDGFPMTANGKADRRRLAELLERPSPGAPPTADASSGSLPARGAGGGRG
jgi:D-alanine--poly(phosphoribitol) ligase subunit 1